MTTNDVATLLRTYADALEETHPAPVGQSADARPVGGQRIAHEESSPILDLVFDAAPRPSWISRVGALSLGLAAAFALLVGFVLLDDEAEIRTGDGAVERLVFEGETLLSESPLIVAAPRPAEPTFDTSGLGERFELTSIDSLDDSGVESFLEDLRLLRNIGGEGDDAEEIVKITLLGQTEMGPSAIVVTDSPRIPDASESSLNQTLRKRYLITGIGGGADGDYFSGDDDLFMLKAPETFVQMSNERGGFDFGSDRVEGNAEPSETLQMIDVSLDVAVLQYVTDGSETVWTVPIDGVAVVPTRLNEDSVVEVVLYSATGEQIYPR